MRPSDVPAESREWRQARRTAFVEEALSVLTQRPAALMSFEHVHERLHLKNVRYLDLQDVPIDRIVGSVGRYQDFTRAFFPRGDHLRSRWETIEQLLATGRSLPPIELYKVGEVFFVRDGNHRVSVARHRGLSSIEAQVWEYDAPVQLQPDSDIDELLCTAAREAFLERTHIDRLCPNLHIELTQPVGYDVLLNEIGRFQEILSRMDGRELSAEEAVTLWCDIRYIPIVDIIRRRAILRDFPGRTEADLYLWLCRNRRELEEGYQQHVMMEEAAGDLSRRFGENLPGVRRVRNAARWAAGATAKWVADMRRAWQTARKRN
ncbi:MAG: hypothetical protein ACK2UA_15355 [Anaerolineae bacterium]|jgi:hypothetical protein